MVDVVVDVISEEDEEEEGDEDEEEEGDEDEEEEEEVVVDVRPAMRFSNSIASRNGDVATRFSNSPADNTQSAASKVSSFSSASDPSSSVKRLKTRRRWYCPSSSTSVSSPHDMPIYLPDAPLTLLLIEPDLREPRWYCGWLIGNNPLQYL